MNSNDFKYQNDLNFCNSLKTLFISAIVLSVLALFGSFIAMIGVFAGLPNPDTIVPWVATTSTLGLILSIPTGIASFIVALIYAIKLLSHHFDHPDLNQQKLIWGILTLIFLGFIAMIVWTCISKSILEKAKTLEHNTDLSQQD